MKRGRGSYDSERSEHESFSDYVDELGQQEPDRSDPVYPESNPPELTPEEKQDRMKPWERLSERENN